MRLLITMGRFLLASWVLWATSTLPATAQGSGNGQRVSWSGCYLGIHIGAAWSRQDALTDQVPVSFNQAPAFVDQDSSNAFGGAHAGCQVQWSNAVFGIEGDFSGGPDANASYPNLQANGDPAITPGGSVEFSRNTDWLATLRGRAGLLINPATLIYATGGLAWQQSEYAGTDSLAITINGVSYVGCPLNCTTTTFRDNGPGYVLGGGAEFALTGNLFLRVEYLYYHFDGASAVSRDGGDLGPRFIWDDLEIQTVRTGMSMKF